MDTREKEIREIAAKALEDVGNETAARWLRENLSLNHPAKIVFSALLPLCSTAAERECVEAWARYVADHVALSAPGYPPKWNAAVEAARRYNLEREPKGPWRQDGHMAVHKDGGRVTFYFNDVRDAGAAAAFVREQNAKERGK